MYLTYFEHDTQDACLNTRLTLMYGMDWWLHAIGAGAGEAYRNPTTVIVVLGRSPLPNRMDH